MTAADYDDDPFVSDSYLRYHDMNDCVRCDGSGLDPDGPRKGMYGTRYCRRCAGTGTREGGPT